MLLGLAIGAERQWRSSMAGLQTNVLVATGSALFVLLSGYDAESGVLDPTRIAAQVVSGIGFLGAGVILRQGATVSGINTAASLWCSAAVGTLAGSGVFLAAAAGTLGVVLANVLLSWASRKLGLSHRHPRTRRGYRLTVECHSPVDPRLLTTLGRLITNGRPVVVHAMRLLDEESRDADQGATEGFVAEVELAIPPAKADDVMGKLVGRLQTEPGVAAVRWTRATPSTETKTNTVTLSQH